VRLAEIVSGMFAGNARKDFLLSEMQAIRAGVWNRVRSR